MMKLILSLTLLWALSSTAEAFVCQNCTDRQCSDTKPVTCSSEMMCITTSIEVTTSGTPAQQIVKSCVPSVICPVSQTVSQNWGYMDVFASTLCCNTDNCNSATLPFPGPHSSNSLQCLSCDSHFDTNCSTPTQCRGIQDRCFQMSVTVGSKIFSTFGCTSMNVCAPDYNLENLPFQQNLGNVTSQMSCCETNLCNDRTTAPTNTTTASDACCIQLGTIHLLLGLLLFFTLY
ncbi:phospholipase A2 inhibitor and Ly6/PLAUR domain-containing protein-like [Seriola lalandi dorsalis]|uniref:phospholipase A2 inhibitor and Ly6/PLAUR domain-containing protein-like n=1 Tax=Seriola lalandi dorsalis TaxID=1841481 RepID=UPI000C6F6C61|nr:phospholipase A2 inhibitor and Ly6/PLAUR domain-containing protein-like [Seriola lalandi dorsalis]